MEIDMNTSAEQIENLKQVEEHAAKMKTTTIPVPSSLRKRGKEGFRNWEELERYAQVTRAMLELSPNATANLFRED
jgi:hypothetical protein